MVAPLARPLAGARTWTWTPDGRPYVRIWHLGGRGPTTATTLRRHGPFGRFDHHVPASEPVGRAERIRPAEPGPRCVVYLAESLRTAGAEVFGNLPIAEVCPAWYASLVRPAAACRLANLRGSGAMRIGALPALGSGNEPRALTQEWAQAIHEDLSVDGIRYTGLMTRARAWRSTNAPLPSGCSTVRSCSCTSARCGAASRSRCTRSACPRSESGGMIVPAARRAESAPCALSGRRQAAGAQPRQDVSR